MLSKAIVEISELRTRVEEVKWHNMRRAVGTMICFFHPSYASLIIFIVTLFSFVALTIVGLELRPKPPTASVPISPPNQIPVIARTTHVNQADGLEKLDWVT